MRVVRQGGWVIYGSLLRIELEVNPGCTCGDIERKLAYRVELW